MVLWFQGTTYQCLDLFSVILFWSLTLLFTRSSKNLNELRYRTVLIHIYFRSAQCIRHWIFHSLVNFLGFTIKCIHILWIQTLSDRKLTKSTYREQIWEWHRMQLWHVQPVISVPLFIHGRLTEHKSCFAGTIVQFYCRGNILSYQNKWMGRAWLSAIVCVSVTLIHTWRLFSLNYWASPLEQLGVALIDKPCIITSDTGLYLISTNTPWAHCVILYTTNVFHNLWYLFVSFLYVLPLKDYSFPSLFCTAYGEEFSHDLYLIGLNSLFWVIESCPVPT